MLFRDTRGISTEYEFKDGRFKGPLHRRPSVLRFQVARQSLDRTPDTGHTTTTSVLDPVVSKRFSNGFLFFSDLTEESVFTSSPSRADNSLHFAYNAPNASVAKSSRLAV